MTERQYDAASDPLPADPGNGADPGDGAEAPVPGDRSSRERVAVRAFLAGVREIVLVLTIALALSLLIKTFLVQAFFIPSPSMENTLIAGDRVLVSKLTPGLTDIRRGDVVVFADRGGWLASPPEVSQGVVRDGIRAALTFVGMLPANSDEHLIKRVIGLPGDRVLCCDKDGRLAVNGVPIEEPYLYPGDEPSAKTFAVEVPSGRLWVMGDHRALSADSRAHQDSPGDGTVAVDDVVGKAFVLVWPLHRADLLRYPESSFVRVPLP